MSIHEEYRLCEEREMLPSGSVKALDELLDLPHLNILLGNVLTHDGQRRIRLLVVTRDAADGKG